MSNAAYKVLGPLQVTWPDGRDVSLSGKQRAVLATLLLHVNTLVPRQRLVAALWETPPSSAISNLQTYITQLRRALGSHARLLTKGAGYVFEAGPSEVDLLTFDQAVRLARTEHGWSAVQQYERALSQWRGRPAEGTELAGPALARVTELEARHAAIRLDWAETKLDLGQPAEVIEDLRAFVAEQPFSERAWRSLMLALSQTGQRDAALDAYRQVRHVLVDELGIEPGKQLQRLHVEILADTVPAIAPDLRRPICQLPPNMADFVGRVDELAQVRAILHPTSDRTTPAIAVLTGPPGIGKTTLAVQVAHGLRDEFPDGQLYLSLKNGSPDTLLADVLRSLRPGSDIPDATEGKGALYRSLLADRAVLVVLDDAEHEEQVRCLLPGTARGAVLVTSRGPLPTLADAIRVSVGLPSEAEALALLARIAGESRVRAEPDAARTIVLACGQLPLAIRVAGARLVTRPAWPLRELATRLTAGPLLDELAVGELNVRTTFAVSYQLLPDLPRRAFRLIGMTGMDSTTEWIVAALLGESARDADVSLEALMAAGLLNAGGVDPGGQPRYRMHELLRSFSSERAYAEDAPEQRELATRRLVAESLKRVRRTGPPGAAAWPAERFLTIARAAGPEAAARLTLADMDLDHGLLPAARNAYQTVFDQDRSAASAVYSLTGILACDLLEGRLAPIGVGEALARFKANGINDLLAGLLDVCGAQPKDRRELVYVLRLALLRSGDQRLGEPTMRFLRALVTGITCFRRQNLDGAAGHYQECIDVSRALGWGAGERYALRRLGEALSS
jgi:DNA-binding SARP family transcriptional activator